MASRIDLRFVAQEIVKHGGGSPISSLSTEVLEAIFDLIYDTSPLTITSLTLVNKTFHNSARYFRDRKHTFNLVRAEDAGFWIDSAQVRDLVSGLSPNIKAIRHITISSPLAQRDRQTVQSLQEFLEFGPGTGNPNPSDLKWNSISHLIAKIQKVNSLTFEAYEQVPLCITEALQEHHPNAELHIRNWTRTSQSEDQNDPAEIALAHSPNLRSIQGKLGNMDESMDLRLPALRRIVALAPKLATVDISIQNNYFCPPVGRARAFTAQQQEQAAMFEERRPPSRSVKTIRSQRGDDLNFLAGAMTLKMLEVLEISEIPTWSGNFFLNNEQGNRFPSLKHLSVHLCSGDIRRATRIRLALTNFLTTCQPLDSLRLSCRAQLLPSYLTILPPHGRQLRTLKIHEPEASHGREEKKPLDLEQIRRLCPFLTDLGIDVDTSVDGTSERDKFCQLAKFPFLTTIRLHFGLTHNQLTTKNAFQRGSPDWTTVTSSWVENIWCELRNHKFENKTAPLQELFITVGEQDRSIGQGGASALWAKREARNRLELVAKPSDRDDSPNDIVVITKINVGKAVRQVRQVPEIVPIPDDTEPTAHENSLFAFECKGTMSNGQIDI